MTDKASNIKPMDTATRELAVGTPAVNAPRICLAAKTLIREVHALFPETPVETSNIDGRNTALDVMFDLTALDDSDNALLSTILTMTETDERVAEVVLDNGSALVSFKSNPRTQDSREEFNLAGAFEILTGDEQ